MHACLLGMLTVQLNKGGHDTAQPKFIDLPECKHWMKHGAKQQFCRATRSAWPCGVLTNACLQVLLIVQLDTGEHDTARPNSLDPPERSHCIKQGA